MGKREDVHKASLEAIQKGSLNNSFFILSSGCEVPNKTPFENIDAMVHSAQKRHLTYPDCQ